jgi:hypothetical protein
MAHPVGFLLLNGKAIDAFSFLMQGSAGLWGSPVVGVHEARNPISQIRTRRVFLVVDSKTPLVSGFGIHPA